MAGAPRGYDGAPQHVRRGHDDERAVVGRPPRLDLRDERGLLGGQRRDPEPPRGGHGSGRDEEDGKATGSHRAILYHQ
jgi:hypothetical protein